MIFLDPTTIRMYIYATSRTRRCVEVSEPTHLLLRLPLHFLVCACRWLFFFLLLPKRDMRHGWVHYTFSLEDGCVKSVAPFRPGWLSVSRKKNGNWQAFRMSNRILYNAPHSFLSFFFPPFILSSFFSSPQFKGLFQKNLLNAMKRIISRRFVFVLFRPSKAVGVVLYINNWIVLFERKFNRV